MTPEIAQQLAKRNELLNELKRIFRTRKADDIPTETLEKIMRLIEKEIEL